MAKYLSEGIAKAKARSLNRDLSPGDFTWSAIHYKGHGWQVREVDAKGVPID
ncbi:MAG: hypothetical protein H6827_09725 [Planctomycetes bacterium]|nr:hypothetical protein [Planctomycetota bacterium]